jgi:predicted membrane GTPase involved in stress response
MKMGETDSADKFGFGRGVLHLSVLIETMKKIYELQIGQPQVVSKGN